MDWWIIILTFWVAIGEGVVSSGLKTKRENCENVQIMKCISAKNQAASEGHLFFPDTKEKLKDYCKHLLEGLQCAKRIIDDCIGEEERNLYYNLTQDMVGMNVRLCTEGSPFANRFLKHVDCYKSLSDRFRICSDQYIGNIVVVQKLSQEEQMKMTCCTVHEYSRCMRNAVEGRCDQDAQKLVEETVITALKQSFGYCQQQSGNSPTSNCQRTFSESKGFATSNLGEDGYNSSGQDISVRTFLFLAMLGLVIALT